MTSEANSYGSVYAKWYDGETVPLYLKKGLIETIQISKITTYEYLEDSCTRETFYECFASKIGSLKCLEDGVYCSPYSIPLLSPPGMATTNW